MPRHRFALASAAAVLLASIATASRAQQASAGSVARGRIVEHVRASGDSSKSYAVYLPTTWTAERKWPVLILLDPGGRGALPVELFRGEAERRGWVLIGSYDARNGAQQALENDDRAVEAMLADAQSRFALDPARLYLGGLSGMARYSWGVAVSLNGQVAGLYGAAAGFPRSPVVWAYTLRDSKPFAYFGTTGTVDFNREEMEEADSTLDATSFPHRLVRFEGEHEWPPAEVAAQAIDWLDLQAMRAGTAPRDPALIDAYYAAGLARARSEEAASPVDAEHDYRALAAAMDGLHDTAEPAARAAALARGSAFQRQRARRAELAGRARGYRQVIDGFMDALRAAPDGKVRAGAVQALRIDALRREVQDSARDREAAQAATRMLTVLGVGVGDQGGAWVRDGHYPQAIAALQVARQALPESGGICHSLARAYAQAGQPAPAFDALSCAAARRAATRADLDADPLLAPLRSDPRWADAVRGAP